MQKLAIFIGALLVALLVGYGAGALHGHKSAEAQLTAQEASHKAAAAKLQAEIDSLKKQLEATEAQLKVEQSVNSPEAKTVKLDRYTVVKGDTLTKIAAKFYGDGNLWGKLYKLNQETVFDPDLIFPGQVLKL